MDIGINKNNILKMAGRLRAISFAWIALSLALAALFLVRPIRTDTYRESEHQRKQLHTMPDTEVNLRPLLMQIAGNPLIKPCQVQAAVKDSGLADRLLKKLKLQGIVQMGGGFAAYINVDKQGVKNVRQGDKILEFIVAKVGPEKVILDLEGIQVKLGH